MTFGMLGAPIKSANVKPLVVTLSRIKDGLVFRDNFNRADGSPGNGWAHGGGYNIENGELVIGATTANFGRNSPLAPIDGITQFNILPPETGGTVGLKVLCDFNSTSNFDGGYYTRKRLNLSGQQLLINSTVVYTASELTGSQGWRLARDTGSNVIEARLAAGLSNIQELDTDFPTASLAVTSSFDATGAWSGLGGSNHSGSRIDEWIECGRTIKVTGTIAGEKVKLIGPAVTRSFTASSNEIEIDVKSYALPITRIEIYDVVDILLTSYQSASGDSDVWGGDVYQIER